MVATLIEAFGRPDSICNELSDILYYSKNIKSECEFKYEDKSLLNCNFKPDDENGFKISAGDGNITYYNNNTLARTNNHTEFTCPSGWTDKGTCYGPIHASCIFNWKECNDIDSNYYTWGCGISSFNYNPITNECYPLNDASGEFTTQKECFNSKVKKWNFLKNWKCDRNANTKIIGDPLTDPQFINENDCKNYANKICNGLISPNPNNRQTSIDLLQMHKGDELSIINCSDYI
jgi:hypothetical protein